MLEHTGLNKLEGFAPVYVINLESRKDRLEYIKNELEKNNIKEYEIFKAIDGSSFNFDEVLFEKDKLKLSNNELGATLSHLKAIEHWYKTSESEYAIIIEDDLSFETVSKWGFTFNEFLKSINKPYDMLQLCIIHNYTINTNLHMREMRDWSAACYLIKRNRAKELIEKHFIDGKYVLPQTRFAVADSLVYHRSKVLSVPLLTYTLDLDSSIDIEGNQNVKDDIKPVMHLSSKQQTLAYWEKNELPKLVL
jgi:GR25 family glycosyltransferase involved in LPS biosynthesis